MLKQIRSNLGFSLLRATEASALVASRWMGRGIIGQTDQAAAVMVRDMLDRVEMQGEVIVGERPQNVSPEVLGKGLMVGNGQGPQMDVVIDSIDGVRLLAEGLPDAISVVAIAPHGTIMRPLPVKHLEKLVVNPDAAHILTPECLDAPAAWTLGVISSALRKNVRDLTVFVLNRQRHHTLIEDIRSTGARVLLRSDGDIMGALLAAMPGSGIDVLMGVGGMPEGLIAACAVKALEGAMLVRPVAENEAEQAKLLQIGLSSGQILSGDDLVSSSDIFLTATGITDGMLLQGVRYGPDTVTTHSLVLNGKSRIRRQIYAEHPIDEVLDEV